MDAFAKVLEDEAHSLHCHESGDCQEPDDRHSETLTRLIRAAPIS